MKKFCLVASIVLCMTLCLASVAIFAADGGIQITVKTTPGKQIDLTVEPGDTILRVKTLIQEKEGIPPDQQRLTFNNQELDEDKTLAEYNITKGSEINLTLRLVKNVSTGEELKAALTGTAVCTVKLTSDITVTYIVDIRKGSSVILDLNGYVFDLGGNKIYVNDSNLATKLTIIDSRPDAEHKFTPNDDGLWVLDETDGTKTVKGGVITGGHSDSSDYAGCIDVGRNGTVIMEVGNIVGCYADGHGGAVHVGGTDGTFIMNGGSIAGCKAGSMGGGVSMDSRSGSFTMNGGSITDCATGIYSSNAGGGVSVERGTFALAGGTIQNCQANEGAGVYVSEDGTFIMTDGIIQNCVANKNVGALYINGGTMNAGGGTVDGTVMINTGYDYNSNSDIPGVIQDIAGSFDATEFKQDVINAGEIKHGTFSGKVTVGDNTYKGVISGGVFNGTVNITDGTNDNEIKNGTFNGIVTIDRGIINNGTFNKDVVVKYEESCTLVLAGGTYNGLIKNNSTNARFEGVHCPLGIVGTKPSANSHVYYKVTFALNGGDMYYTERCFCNNRNISDRIEPTKEGCIFDGWYKADGTKWDCASDVVTEDMTLMAMWKHIHCICGGNTTVGDHTAHADIDWMPWMSTDSLPTTAGNYYLVGDVTLPEGNVAIPDGVNICLNGNKINDGKKYAVYTEISVADSGTFSVTDCGTAGGFGNFDMLDGKLVIYGGKIIKDSALRINDGTSFLMTGNAQNEGVIVIKGSANFIMNGNAKNNGFISLLETGGKGTAEICGRADGGKVVVYQPKQDAKIHLSDNAKIPEMYAVSQCTIGLVMQNDAEIGKVKNLEFESPELSGNAKLGSDDLIFSISTPTGSENTFTIGDDVELIGTVTIINKSATQLILKDNASVKGSLTISNNAEDVLFNIQDDVAIHGDLKCEGIAIYISTDDTIIDGAIDIGDSRVVSGKLTCSGEIKSGSFNDEVVNSGKITGGIFYGTVTGTGIIEDSAKVDVVFNTDNDSNVTMQKILRGQKTTKPADLAKTGYSFGGWLNCGLVYNFDEPVIDDIALKAKWTVNQYTITVKPGNGEEDIIIKQDYGTAVIVPTLTKTGYTFTGWDVAFPTTMPAENVTITARWRDVEKPTGDITIGTYKWYVFLGELTSGVFFNAKQTVTINATDNSGTVFAGYYVTDEDLSESDLKSLLFKGYDGSFDIEANGKYIVYVMLVDESLNITYLRSDRITIDNVPPIISGIENGKIYCSTKTVTITEENLHGVYVNNELIYLDENNSFVLAFEVGKQTISVYDKAGNVTEMTVTINNGHIPEADDGDCTTAIVCECGYVIKAAESHHNLGKWRYSGGDVHTRKCNSEGCIYSETEDCSGGKATCMKKAVCEVCGASYGKFNEDNHTGKIKWVYDSEKHKAYYSCCNSSVSGEEKHNLVNGKCNKCGYGCAHEGGKATCTQKAICTICGCEYGTLDTNNHISKAEWTHTASSHEEKYSCCGAVITASEKHEWKDGVCDKCGYECVHEGGKATCAHKAVCSVCGCGYGDINPDAHEKLTRVPATAATAKNEGVKKHWRCQACGKLFAESNGKTELKTDDTVIEKLEPKVNPQGNGKWTKGDDSSLIFDYDGDAETVLIDGKTSDGVTVKDGIIEIDKDTLKDLSKGKHTLTVVSTDGKESSVEFEIFADDFALISIVLTASAVVAVVGAGGVIIVVRRKKTEH